VLEGFRNARRRDLGGSWSGSGIWRDRAEQLDGHFGGKAAEPEIATNSDDPALYLLPISAKVGAASFLRGVWLGKPSAGTCICTLLDELVRLNMPIERACRVELNLRVRASDGSEDTRLRNGFLALLI
jgi:hypothetical protein